MTAAAVAADNARYDPMDALTNVTGIGGGAGATVETDIYYQNNLAISRKVTGAGFYTSTGANRDMTATGRKTWLVKIWLTNYGSLLTGGNSLVVRIGSGTGAYYEYIIANPSRLYPTNGGWVFAAIDPNIAGWRDSTTGSPSLTACNYFAAYATCSGSKGENLVLDAVDVGVGLYLTGGTSPDPAGDFDDFIAADEGTPTTGRWAYCSTREGIIYFLGQLLIGATSTAGSRSAQSTVFADTGKTIVFPDHRADAFFSEFRVDLTGTGTSVSLTRCTLISAGSSGGAVDTRTPFSVSGTNGALTVTGGSITNFHFIILNSKCTFNNVVFTLCNEIQAAGADMRGSRVIGSTATRALYWNVATDPDGKLDNMTFESGGSGHALQFGTSAASPMTLRGISVSGYAATDGSTGDETIYNNSGGHLTINLVGCTGTFSVRNGAGATTTLVPDPATLQITVTDIDSGAVIQGARVLAYAATGGSMPADVSVSITQTGGTATVTHATHGLSTNDKVVIDGANEAGYNGVHTITVTGASSYTYPVPTGTPSPATGAPKASEAIISALTNASGIVTDTRPYSTDQPIRGFVRKGTASPVYRAAPLAGNTVDSVAGVAIAVQLIPDS